MAKLKKKAPVAKKTKTARIPDKQPRKSKKVAAVIAPVVDNKARVGNYRKRDLEIATRSYQDLYDDGRFRYRTGGKRYNNEVLKNVYFTNLPKDLQVTPDTPVGTLVWQAREFSERSRNPYVLIKHHPANEYDTMGGVVLKEDVGGAPTMSAFYDAVCLIPDKQRLKHVNKVEATEEYNTQRKQELKAPKPTKQELLVGKTKKKRVAKSQPVSKAKPKAKTIPKAKVKPKPSHTRKKKK